MKQYIRRPLVVGILAALWDECNVLTYPFGCHASSCRYGEWLEPPPHDVALSVEVENAQATRNIHQPIDDTPECDLVNSDAVPTLKEVTLSRDWVERNTLDPYIHRSIFHYLRA